MDKIEITDHERAIALISEGSIALVKGKEEDNYYHVKGMQDEYLVVMPNFCTCEHFILRCLNTPGDVCYHILAVQMSGKIDKISKEDWIKLLLKQH